MASFKFSLESILKLKIQFENSVKNELGKAVSSMLAEEEKLSQLFLKLSATLEEMKHNGEKMWIADMKAYSQYVESLKSRIEEQKDRVNQAAEIVDNIRGKLTEAAKEREIFEKLKQKEKEDFLKESLKAEEKMTDEFISFKRNQVEW